MNGVAGEVHAIENQGSYVKVTVDLGDGEEFVANVLDEDYFVDPIDIGDARWRAGRRATCGCWKTGVPAVVSTGRHRRG